MTSPYRAMVSSDWSECLSPCGPFDGLSFIYPQLAEELNAVFRQYTGNRISLGRAADRIAELLPAPLSAGQMDAYLDASFATYKGVPDLIQWCLDNRILFMINSTGMIGYFQRIFAGKLLPRVPALSAHPMIHYPQSNTDPARVLELRETRDKGRNTEAVAKAEAIPADKIILMGDSGGDGPHFEWGSRTGAYLIGSMTKASLSSYCREKDISVNFRFGLDYASGKGSNPGMESDIDFRDLIATIEEFLRC